MNGFESAVMASGLTKTEVARIIGLKSYQAASTRLQKPSSLRMNDIKSLNDKMDENGRIILRKAINEFFWPDD
ncbi:hypothetical protein HLV35_07395 [Eggerthellaceae bacterium zg-997]|nr:hypothetical protein [Eggerthellaceae bacterium zg-997]